MFLFFSPDLGGRHVAVTDQRTKRDFAHQMKWLTDEHFPQVQVIRVILDNLNTHRPAALYEAFAPEEACQILRQLEFHYPMAVPQGYTPKHGSWLNRAELELSVFDRLYWDRRIGEQETLIRETGALEDTRNAARASVNWQFTDQTARVKLHRLYPSLSR